MAYFLSMVLPTYTQIMTGHMRIKVLKSATNWNVINAFGILPCQLKTDYSLALINCMMGTAFFIMRNINILVPAIVTWIHETLSID
jgi:hypothetical protein